MDNKFSLSVKDVAYLASMILALAGSWFSLESKVREYEVTKAADEKIHAAEMRTFEARIETLESQLSELQLTIAKSNKK